MCGFVTLRRLMTNTPRNALAIENVSNWENMIIGSPQLRRCCSVIPTCSVKIRQRIHIGTNWGADKHIAIQHCVWKRYFYV